MSQDATTAAQTNKRATLMVQSKQHDATGCKQHEVSSTSRISHQAFVLSKLTASTNVRSIYVRWEPHGNQYMNISVFNYT
eukprot:3485473-Amphidinium_carterae.2